MPTLIRIELRSALIERIERYRHKRGVASINDAVEALIRIGLFIDAAPDGAVLMRRDERSELQSPETGSDDAIVF